MSNVCEKHRCEPAIIYGQCVGCELDGLRAENKKLKAAIQKTLSDNGHLADGDVCTLIDLKNALKS